MNLLLIIAGTGAVVYKGGEVLVKTGVKVINKKRTEQRLIAESNVKEYVVKAFGVSNEGLAFEVGEMFRVLETDGDAVLIEKKGDAYNPYFVSEDLLKEISDYKN